MKPHHATSLLLLFILMMPGCSKADNKSPDVEKGIRTSLDQGGLKDVSVSQDRDKGVVTLAGKVPSESDKSQAETLAKSQAAGQVVANQIEVVPPENKSDASSINNDIDKGIEKNLDAALTQKKLNDDVKYDVKNAVVTLSGNVNSTSLRQEAEKVASAVPNVKQVVNEIQLKDQKASTRK
jgi:hyperosmotically inducible periplasmic protein